MGGGGDRRGSTYKEALLNQISEIVGRTALKDELWSQDGVSSSSPSCLTSQVRSPFNDQNQQ